MVTNFIPTTDDLALNVAGFRQTLEQRNRRPQTITSSIQACDLFEKYLRSQGMPLQVAHIKREHVESFIVQLLRTRSPNTAANRYRSLQQFFRCLVDEGK